MVVFRGVSIRPHDFEVSVKHALGGQLCSLITAKHLRCRIYQQPFIRPALRCQVAHGVQCAVFVVIAGHVRTAGRHRHLHIRQAIRFARRDLHHPAVARRLGMTVH